MPFITFVLGLAMIAIGVAGYILPETKSFTALIPAAFGAVITASGLLAFKPEKRKLWMHIAVVMALLGVLGTLGSDPGLITDPGRIGDSYDSVFGAEPGTEGRYDGMAPMAKAAFVLLCALLLALGIQSFIAARKKSKQ